MEARAAGCADVAQNDSRDDVDCDWGCEEGMLEGRGLVDGAGEEEIGFAVGD